MPNYGLGGGEKILMKDYLKRIPAYENKDPRCGYPFEVHPLGYCWGWANAVDDGREQEFLINSCLHCESWKEQEKGGDDGNEN